MKNLHTLKNALIGRKSSKQRRMKLCLHRDDDQDKILPVTQNRKDVASKIGSHNFALKNVEPVKFDVVNKISGMGTCG